MLNISTRNRVVKDTSDSDNGSNVEVDCHNCSLGSVLSCPPCNTKMIKK